MTNAPYDNSLSRSGFFSTFGVISPGRKSDYFCMVCGLAVPPLVRFQIEPVTVQNNLVKWNIFPRYRIQRYLFGFITISKRPSNIHFRINILCGFVRITDWSVTAVYLKAVVDRSGLFRHLFFASPWSSSSSESVSVSFLFWTTHSCPVSVSTRMFRISFLFS